MKLLVTGGAGYIGSVVTAQLLSEGHDVVVFDNLVKGHRNSVPTGAEFIEGDLTLPEQIQQAITSDVDGVMHLAALSVVGESVTHPAQYWRVNVGGTQNLLDAMRLAGVARLVFSSTAATYGNPADVPLTEGSPTKPTSPYGASKLAVDHLISSYCAAYRIGAFSLRYFNVAGAHGDIGELHDPETHLIPNILNAVRHQDTPVRVFGRDWPTPDGTAIRDYIHVTDLAIAHSLALAACVPGTHEIVNLGTGTGHSVLEVINAVERITQRPVPREYVDRRAGDPAVLVASNAKAEQVLHWRPERSLDDIVASAWRYMGNS